MCTFIELFCRYTVYNDNKGFQFSSVFFSVCGESQIDKERWWGVGDSMTAAQEKIWISSQPPPLLSMSSQLVQLDFKLQLNSDSCL